MTNEYAKLTLEVEVHYETTPGIFTPDRNEIPEEYLTVREVEVTSCEIFGNPHAVKLIEYRGVWDLDPDDMLRDAVGNALLAKLPNQEDAPVEPSRY